MTTDTIASNTIILPDATTPALSEEDIKRLRGEYGTPDDLWRAVACEFGPGLDVCANYYNARVPHFYTEADDALSIDWWTEDVVPRDTDRAQRMPEHIFYKCPHRVAWCNPPHEDFYPWAARCREQVALGHVDEALLLCLPSFSAAWWREHVVRGADEVRLLMGRVQFAPPPELVEAGIVGADDRNNDSERALAIFRRRRTTTPGAPRIWSWDWRAAFDIPMTKDEEEGE